MPVITALYAGILGLMSIVLALGAGSLRGKLKVSIGDGGHPELLLAMRRHGNFVEFVPLALILIGLLEMNGVGATALHALGNVHGRQAPYMAAIHALGAALVLARVCHATGLKADTLAGPTRAIGAVGTMLVVVVASVWAITLSF